MIPFSKFRFVELSIPYLTRRRYGKQKIPKPIGLGMTLVGACLPQTLLDKSKGALPAPMLCLSLLLFQFKLTLLFCFALFTANCFSYQLIFFSLHLQRLL